MFESWALVFLCRGRASSPQPRPGPVRALRPEHRPPPPAIAHTLTRAARPDCCGHSLSDKATEQEQRDFIHHAQNSYRDLCGLELYRSFKNIRETLKREKAADGQTADASALPAADPELQARSAPPLPSRHSPATSHQTARTRARPTPPEGGAAGRCPGPGCGRAERAGSALWMAGGAALWRPRAAGRGCEGGPRPQGRAPGIPPLEGL